MSFDSKDPSSAVHEDQLSLLDFKMQNTDFEEPSSAQSDYQSWALAHQEPETSGTARFLTMSATVHIAAAVLIAIMSVPLVEKAKTETITIEIEDTTPALAKGFDVPATQGEAAHAAPAEMVAEEITATAIEPGDIVQTPQKTIAKAKPASKKAAPIAKAAKASRNATAKTDFQAVPATLDDLDAPSLDEGALAAAPMKASLNDDFNDDLDQVDAAHAAAVANEKNALDSMANNFAAEQENELGALDQQTQDEASEYKAAAADLKQRNAKAVANALAAEKAEADRAAQARVAAAQAASAARAKAQAQAAAAAQQGAGHGNGQGQRPGQGAGNNGVDQAQNMQAGSPQGVRSLDQLRQMPGNPRPQYDRDERLKGHQGEVAFLAYISKSGSVEKFRLVKSTGFRNLDEKTLTALKKWRFYPGQEGWVELPFKWDLKGGSEQDGGMLRAAVSDY